MIAEVVCCSMCVWGGVHEVESEGDDDKANVDSYEYNGEARYYIYCKHY